MNSMSFQELKREGKAGLTIMTVILLVLAGVLFLQSRAFNSSLWVLLEFAYGTWQEDLWQILRTLVIWAAFTGVIFAVEFASNPANTDSKRSLKSMLNGFVSGFTFTYFLVFGLGILIFIPLGLLSLFIEDIIEYATLEFAWLSAAYILFLWIAVDAPLLLLDGMRYGRGFVKLLAGTLMLLLVVQVLETLMSVLQIILESSRWLTRMDAGLLAVFGSLAVTLFVSRMTLGPLPLRNMVFPVIGIYIASIATGNLSHIIFHWGDLPSALAAAFVGPVIYSQAAKAILQYGIVSVFGIFGTFTGMLVGLLIAHYTKLAIIGQGFFGVLCGTSIAVLFGIAFGGMLGQTLISMLVNKTRLKPEIAMSAGFGFILGIILGTVLGGFLAR